MRKRVFAIHMIPMDAPTMLDVVFWRRYRDGRTVANPCHYTLDRHHRLVRFIDRLGAVHGVTEVYDHPAYGGGLLYRAINIKGRYGADWSFDSLTPSAEVKPPFVFPEYDEFSMWPREGDWPDEWE